MGPPSRSGSGLSSRGKAVGVTWQRARPAHSDERAAWKLRAAERAAEAAAARYRELRIASSAAGDAPLSRGPLPTWQQLLLLVIGGGLVAGLLVTWLLVAAYLGPAALLVLPAIAGLVAVIRALLRGHRPVARTRCRRPLVADLVRATQELHDAEAALQRARGEHGSAPGPLNAAGYTPLLD
jgi:hypothetical protein